MTDMPHRDASTDRLLRRHLPPSPDPPTTDSCLDADTASAWIAGRLSGAALDEARHHVADCARCQTLMAKLTRLESEPAAASAEDAPARWWRWLVPIGVVAAMLAVVLFVPREAPRPTSPVVREQAAARQDQSKDLAFRPAPSAADAKKDARDEGRVGERDQKLEAPKPAAPVAPPTAASPAATQPDAATLATKNAAMQPRQAAPPPPSGSAALDKTQSTAAASANATGAAAAPARSLGGLQRAASPANELTDAFRVDVVSSDGTTRWRISSHAVEKSTDGGATWTTAVTVTDGRWTAGAAPSSTALWLVGRQGLVERTTDGRTFQRVTFPETTDLSAIQATSAETATITTADGRSFGTTDGGKTWVQRLLQETPAVPFKN